MFDRNWQRIIGISYQFQQTDGKMETEPIIINAKVSSIIKDEGKHATMGFSCVERNIAPRRYLRGDHWILFNHIEVRCKSP